MENMQDFVITKGVLEEYKGPGGDVAIPASVTEIESSAFYGCKKLTIHAPAGSAAEQYAKENGIRFEAARKA
ncbi:MAG: hypothetical protein HFF33_00235 [Oscillospiraceae bacterium]|nr:hypothetical protein [Oscillospiraceae bacterium]